MQDKSLFVGVDAGFGIDCRREVEGFGERWLDLPDQAEPGSKLAM